MEAWTKADKDRLTAMAIRQRKSLTVDVIHRERITFRFGATVRDRESNNIVTLIMPDFDKALVRYRKWIDTSKEYEYKYYSTDWINLRPCDEKNYA